MKLGLRLLFWAVNGLEFHITNPEAKTALLELSSYSILFQEDGLMVIADPNSGDETNQQSLSSTASTSHFFGLTRWKAPEILSGAGESTQASVVFTCGILLYEILSLKEPFHTNDNAGARRRIVDGEALSLLHPSVHGSEAVLCLVDILSRCLTMNPTQRVSLAELKKLLFRKISEIEDEENDKESEEESNSSAG